jgi:pre-mRNA-processing factor 17
VPFCSVFHPTNENEVLVGQSNKKIAQWDMRSDKITQQYEEHLGPVNTITFIDNNRRFVSTSDDKKILVWEYGIPVVVKHISEPDMHSMPAVAMSPNGKYFVGQSQGNYSTATPHIISDHHIANFNSIPQSMLCVMRGVDGTDNQILLFDSFNRFKLNRKKRFVGHLTAGNP